MAARTAVEPITQAHIDSAYRREDWDGYGYLGTRRGALRTYRTTEPEATDVSQFVAPADERIIAIANEKRWTPEQFFTWLNSKNGRWYGEAWFYGPGAGGETHYTRAILERDIESTARLPK
jgi:hypothetical protein